MPDFTREKIKAIFYELMRENPMLISSVLSICRIEFTDKVPTLAVTFGKSPILMINDQFIEDVCLTDEHVKALLFHEFLHILLGHCMEEPKNEGELVINNIAFDAIINAIIHRQFGKSYSSMMSRCYANSSYPLCLLRKPEDSDLKKSKYSEIWRSLYDDKVVSGDLQEFLRETISKYCRVGILGRTSPGDKSAKKDSKRGDNHQARPLDRTVGRILGKLLGNHSGSKKIPEEMKKKVEKILNSGVSGLDKITGVKSRGAYDSLDNLLVSESDNRKREWETKIYNILQKFIVFDKSSSLSEKKLSDSIIPVLSYKDRRSFLEILWNPFIPFSTWQLTKPAKRESANVYLDVSGSMKDELSSLVKVLFYLSPYIKKPLWGFSNHVSKAVIKCGKLYTKSTLGTDLVCVMKHIIKTKPPTAIIVTDGIVGQVPKYLLDKALSKTKIAAIISKYGYPNEIKKMGIEYYMIEEEAP